MYFLKIVLPNYNFLEGYKKNIQQITAQTYTNSRDLTVIISDDSCNNEIESYFNEYHRKFKNYSYFKGPQSGAVLNWNKCMRIKNSKYTMILHHDEYILSNLFIENLFEVLVKKNYDIVILPLLKDFKGKRYKHYPTFLKWIYVYFPSLLFACNAFGSPSVIVYKTNISEEYDEKLRWFVDVDWYYRLLKKTRNVGVLSGEVYTIISNLDFENTATNNMNTSEIAPFEKAYLQKKHSLAWIIYSRLLKPLQFPVMFYKLIRSRIY